MKKSIYLFNPGRLERENFTIKFTKYKDEDSQEVIEKKFLPIENIEEIYVFGSLDANSAFYNFLGKNQIPVHFFDYYGFYTGSFMPKDYLLAGKVLIAQTSAYLNNEKRVKIAKKILEGAIYNLKKNLKYYINEYKNQIQLQEILKKIEEEESLLSDVTSIEELLGIEGTVRRFYYSSFEEILNTFEFIERTKRPPQNEINALISFGNMLCYTTILTQIYHTQLNPTISFLHQPGERRYSLALDLSEIFKPILVDKVIFKLVNKRMISETDFVKKTEGVFLNKKGKEKFIKVYDERLKETIQHKTLKKKVSYKLLIRLEAYKIIKEVLDIQEYKPLKIWT